MNINWKIEKIDCISQLGDLSNVVYTIHWRVYVSEGDNVASVYGSNEIEISSESTFIPYEQLTEEVVLGWTFGALGEDGKATAELGATSALEQMLAPKIISNDVPWG